MLWCMKSLSRRLRLPLENLNLPQGKQKNFKMDDGEISRPKLQDLKLDRKSPKTSPSNLRFCNFGFEISLRSFSNFPSPSLDSPKLRSSCALSNSPLPHNTFRLCSPFWYNGIDESSVRRSHRQAKH